MSVELKQNPLDLVHKNQSKTAEYWSDYYAKIVDNYNVSIFHFDFRFFLHISNYYRFQLQIQQIT